jgi:putative membrane protein
MIGRPMVGRRSRVEGSLMVELVVKILINAAALLVAVKILPSNLISFKFGDDWWKLIVVALVFAIVNTYVRPIVKALSMPVGLLTLGLVGFVINAAMLLLTALASDSLKLGFKLGTFPPTINSDAIVGALVAAVIISVVSTLASVALSPRKLM